VPNPNVARWVSKARTSVGKRVTARSAGRTAGTAAQRGFNPLTPKDPYSGRTAPLTSKRFILYIYSTNTSTEYFKHGINSPFLSLQNAVCFVFLTYFVPVLFTFYIKCAKIKKKIIPALKG